MLISTLIIVCNFCKYLNTFLDQELDSGGGAKPRNVRCYETFLLYKVINAIRSEGVDFR